jgi:putative transcriptional regulator
MPGLGERLLESMQEFQAHLRGEIRGPETTYRVPPETDIRELRARPRLSQAKFAALFGFSARAVQDGEQGCRRPEAPVRAYLAVIGRDPKPAIRALQAA